MPKKIKIKRNELWNLDSTLADIIHQYLVAFKNEEGRMGILYSHEFEKEDFDPGEEYSNDTDWFLDELIWTFKVISEGGVDSIKEIDKLIMEIYGKEDAMVIGEGGVVSFNIDEEKNKELRALQQLHQDRVNKNLAMFAKYFEGLWD